MRPLVFPAYYKHTIPVRILTTPPPPASLWATGLVCLVPKSFLQRLYHKEPPSLPKAKNLIKSEKGSSLLCELWI